MIDTLGLVMFMLLSFLESGSIVGGRFNLRECSNVSYLLVKVNPNRYLRAAVPRDRRVPYLRHCDCIIGRRSSVKRRDAYCISYERKIAFFPLRQVNKCVVIPTESRSNTFLSPLNVRLRVIQ